MLAVHNLQSLQQLAAHLRQAAAAAAPRLKENTMEMHASRPLAVSQQQAWEALNDPQTLQQCLAGCEKFEDAGDGSYAVTMSVRSVRYRPSSMAGHAVRRAAAQSYTIAFEGQGGVAGFGKGQAKVDLTPVDDACEHYEVQAQVGGKIAQLGQRLIDGAAKSMAEDFFARFEALMQQRHASEQPEDEGSAQEPDTRAPGNTTRPPATPRWTPCPRRRRANRLASVWAWGPGAVIVLGRSGC
jgi:carbon monoxide dehydrogenase subunit G